MRAGQFSRRYDEKAQHLSWGWNDESSGISKKSILGATKHERRRARNGNLDAAAKFTVATTAAAVHATSNVPPGRSRTLRAAIPGRDRKRSQQALDPRPRPALVSRQAPHRARYTPASSTISASAFAQTGEIV